MWGFLIPALGLTQDRPPHPAAVTWGKRPAAPADLPDGFGRGHVPPNLAVVAPPPLVVGVVAAVHPGPALGVLGSLLGMLAVLVGLTTIGGRLLGVRLSWWRALIAAGPGFVAGLIFVWAVSGRQHGPQQLSVPAILAAALIATMMLTVLLELLARPGKLAGVQGGLASIPHPVRSLQRRAGRARRYAQITRIAARHGLAAYLGGGRQAATAAGRHRLAHSLRGALEEAGGIFVKLGQLLSTRSDLLPPDVTAELAGLQDGVLPAPCVAVEVLLAAELGAAPAAVFAQFDAQPLAAASIAQAHRARLTTGEQVIVKVQRPGVRALVERDLDILLQLAHTLEARAAWARGYRVVDLARGFADALTEELDFRVEARNIAAVAAATAPTAAVRLPGVYAGMSTSRVLVIDWLDGPGVRDAGPLLDRLGTDRTALARELLGAMLRQVLLDGTFHADPHPGNVLVLGDGRLALIDFGSVGRLDSLQQAGLRRLLLAVARRNPTELHDAILDIAEVRHGIDDDLLERALAHFMAQHLGPGMTPGAAMFTDLFGLLLDFGIAFPPEIGGVFRALVTLDGTLGLLAPGFQIVDETRTLTTRLLGEFLRPTSLRAAAGDELLALLPVLRRLPRRLDRIATALERGTLSTNVRLFADQRDTRVVAGLVNRAVLAFLGIGSGIVSVVLLGTRGGPALTPTTSALQLFGYLGLFSSVVLVLRVVIAIVRDRTG